MHSLSSHVFIENEIKLLQDVVVNKLLFCNDKMDKKGTTCTFIFGHFAIKPLVEVDL